MAGFWQDVRFGLRMLVKEPGFTVIAVVTLALGIGANTAIFSLGNVFMFKPLPVKDADRMTVVAVQSKTDTDPNQMSYLDYLDYRSQSTSVFTDMTGYILDLTGLSYQGHADRMIMAYVPGNFFTMLGLHPAAGRLIAPGEGDAPKTGPVVVLGYSYWQKRFGGDRGILGRSVSLDGNAVTVIGVVPEEFHGPYNVVELDAYAPVGMLGFRPGREFFTSRTDREVRVLATLKPGVGIQQAEAELNVTAKQLAQQYPQADQGQVARVFPEKLARPEPAVANVMPLVASIFLTMVGLVLLVACVNVANLLLARASAREREISIRAAMGAGRIRLIRQLLTESLLLAIAGGVAGAIAGNWVCHLLNGLRPLGDFPLRLAFAFDWRVFGYTTGVAVLAGVIAGLAPALRVARADVNEVLREGGRGLVGDSGRHWLRHGLVVAQVAGSLVLLVTAGLFVRSLQKAETIDLGFDPHNVLNVGLDPGLQGYDQQRSEALLRSLLDKARVLPGVESASMAYSVPLSYYNDFDRVYAEGQAVPPDKRVPGASLNPVSEDYFTTMRMKILEGRAFTRADVATSQPVAIVNQTMAERFWPRQDAIGRRFSHKSASGPFVTVVGVVRDSKESSLLDPPGMYFYLPQTQSYRSVHVLQLRTAVPPDSLTLAVEGLVRQIDPNLPTYDVMSMDKSLQGANGFFLFKIGAAFAGALGGLGLLLAIVGVYGTVSYSASRRKHEIGIRMALGARPGSVLKLVMRQAGLLVAAGVAIGVAVALGVTRILVSFLVGVSSYDPATYAVVAAALITAAVVACYIPAHRAVRIDPMDALRNE